MQLWGEQRWGERCTLGHNALTRLGPQSYGDSSGLAQLPTWWFLIRYMVGLCTHVPVSVCMWMCVCKHSLIEIDVNLCDRVADSCHPGVAGKRAVRSGFLTKI
ncbi:hypothetical protein TGMAS_416040 [Toxoplasma gondii MAS]|uniref:Uncharacterized protein n=1 Tax=Toxoplasma gondii MAS TaxID=943118 RepID=A0A086Q1H1_TOXGO|nr:hypothetical protein TGMAS_416040 [Toxoplasma gondii MAS]